MLISAGAIESNKSPPQPQTQAARFAALHHLGWYGPFGLRLPITVGSVARGIKLAQYAIEHYRYVMAATGFVTEIAIAERIVRWCHRGGQSSAGGMPKESCASHG